VSTSEPRNFIAVMQVTLDGYTLDADNQSDWVDSWADGLGLLPVIDAFILGGGMFPDYEQFWATVLNDPATVAGWIGRAPYPREAAYARIASETPHMVVSTTIEEVTWPTAQVVRDIDTLRAFKEEPGAPAYVVGGPGLLKSLLEAGLIDELRLIVHPVVVGSGTALFDGISEPQTLNVVAAEPAETGRLHLTCRPTTEPAVANAA
jgi:dihydrofolate reductase